MIPWPPGPYRASAPSNRPQPLLTEVLGQARRPQVAGLPAILTLRHLAEQVAVDYAVLREIVSRERKHPYRLFKIRKRRSTDRRLICVAEPPLARVQQWLSRYVLRSLTAHSISHAFAPGASIMKCAGMHLGARWLVKLDLRNFFETISKKQSLRMKWGPTDAKGVTPRLASPSPSGGAWRRAGSGDEAG